VLCCVPAPRFDRTITVDTPDIKGREQIFRVHLGKLKLEKAVEQYSGGGGPAVCCVRGVRGGDVSRVVVFAGGLCFSKYAL